MGKECRESKEHKVENLPDRFQTTWCELYRKMVDEEGNHAPDLSKLEEGAVLSYEDATKDAVG